MKWSDRLKLTLVKSKFRILATFSKRKAAESAFNLFSSPGPGTRKKKPEIFRLSKHIKINLGNYRIWGHRWNHPADKKVLILHGFNSNSGNFHHFIMPLVKKNYEVVTFDAPAHGHSSGKTVTALEYKAMIELANKEYGPFDAYIAHSFGGLALALALESMIHSEKTKVVFIAPATETSTAIDKFFEMVSLNGKVKEEFYKIILEKEGKPADWYSIRRAMKNIKAQVLWFHDKYDSVTPVKDAMKVVEDNHSNLKFELTKKLGHRHIYRNDDVLEKIVEFL